MKGKIIIKIYYLILSTKYQYLSFKYGMNEAGWYSKIDLQMGKVKKKSQLLDIIALIEDI